MKKLFTIIAFLLLAGCGKKEQPVAQSPQPEEVVRSVYKALEQQDTGAYVNLFAEGRRGFYRANPAALLQSVNYWKGSKFAINVLNTSRDSTVSTVTYHVKSDGGPAEDTTVTVQLYLEDDGWKFGG